MKLKQHLNDNKGLAKLGQHIKNRKAQLNNIPIGDIIKYIEAQGYTVMHDKEARELRGLKLKQLRTTGSGLTFIKSGKDHKGGYAEYKNSKGKIKRIYDT